MYKLYYMPGACSLAVHVLLKELGQEVNLEGINNPSGDGRSAEFLKINPRGNVPVLVEENGNVLREGGAIMAYLLDKHKSPMLPAAGIDRAKALEWLMFANSSMHPAYARVFFLRRALSDSAAQEEAVKAACEQINKLWADLNAHLAHSTYTCGEECSAADILLAVIANWSPRMGYPITFGSNVERLLKNVVARPTFREAMKLEGVEYKVLG